MNTQSLAVRCWSCAAVVLYWLGSTPSPTYVCDMSRLPGLRGSMKPALTFFVAAAQAASSFTISDDALSLLQVLHWRSS